MFYFLPIRAHVTRNKREDLEKPAVDRKMSLAKSKAAGTAMQKEDILPANRWKFLTETSRLTKMCSRKVSNLIFLSSGKGRH